MLIAFFALFLLTPQTIGMWAGAISEQPIIIRILAMVGGGLILLLLTWLQIRPDPKARMAGLMMRASGAITEVSVESARERILKAVSDVPDVVSAEAQVQPIRGRADIEMDVTVFGYDVKLPNKQKEINRALNQVINKQLGLRMASQPRIHIKIYGEEPKKPAPVIEKPLPPPPPVSVIVEKPAPPLEPEPKQTTGFLGGWRREPEIEPVVSTPSEPDPVPQKVEVQQDEFVKPSEPDFESGVDSEKISSGSSGSFVLNLEKEIADSSTEDFVDEELGIKQVSGPDVGDLNDAADSDEPKDPDTTKR
ncbi:MAG: hypothetical protein K8L97_17265 [Anaerolineae bacterium]|nr:hypothetical protein [Anaerolineae bacterium]